MPPDLLDISVVRIRRKLVVALVLGELLPFLAIVYLVGALLWPGALAGGLGGRSRWPSC